MFLSSAAATMKKSCVETVANNIINLPSENAAGSDQDERLVKKTVVVVVVVVVEGLCNW